MAKKNTKRFLHGCAGKVKHKSFLGAEYALMDNPNNTNAEIYECTECKYWHIGTLANKKRKNPKTVSRTKENNEHKKKHKSFRKMKY